MATKYTLNRDTDRRTRIMERLDARVAAHRGGPARVRSGSGMLVSVTLLIVALLMFQSAVDRMMGNSVRVTTAVAEVVGKAEADPEALGEQPMLQVRFEAGGVVRELWVPIAPADWVTTAVGERLEVEYTLEKDGTARVLRLHRQHDTGAARLVGPAVPAVYSV